MLYNQIQFSFNAVFTLKVWFHWVHKSCKFKNLSQHYVKSVLIKSYSSPHFSCISRIRTEYGEISPYSVRMRKNAGKMLTRITPNKDAFYAVQSYTLESL